MKVLHLVSGNLYGGVEAMLVTLARHQHAAPGMTPLYALCFDGRLRRELESTGYPPAMLGEVRTSRPWTIRRARRKLELLLRTQPIDVAACHGAWTHVMFGPVLRRSSVPFALFLHDVARGRHWVEHWARRTRPDAIVANSAFTAATSSALFEDLAARVFHCPVPPPSAVSAEERQRVRSELGVRADQVVIIQASRMQPWKGQREHLLTLAGLRHLPTWISLQVGGPQRSSEEPYFTALERLARELCIADRVKFLGQRSDVPRLLAAADIHFQPNEGPEPFGIAFVEAMLAGLPVVTYRRGAVPEVLGAAEGFLCSSRSELASALSSLLVSPDQRRQMGESARRRAVTICHPSHRLPALEQLLMSVRSPALKQQWILTRR